MAKWVTDKRLYLSEDGQVVDEAAPGRKTLLAPAGSQVTDEVCRRHGLGPYAEVPHPSTDSGQAPSSLPEGDGENKATEEATDPEAAGSCCSHAFRVHRKGDGLCSQRRHCGCQGWQSQPAGDGEGSAKGDSDDGNSGPESRDSDQETGEAGGDGSNAQGPAV